MTDELATEKQVNFIKTLAKRQNKPEPDLKYLTKGGAKILIDEWLGKDQTAEQPVEEPIETVKMGQKPSKEGYHLTVERCRVYALDCAMKHIELMQPTGMKNLSAKLVQDEADIYFEYIMQDGKL